MTGPDAQAVIDGPIEGGGIAEKIGVFPLEMAHLFDDVNPLRCVQNFIEYSSPFEPQIHQREIDVVVAASSSLQRIACALLFFEARAHLRQLLARAAALSVAPP